MNKKILLLFLCFLLIFPFLRIKAENNQTRNGDGTYDLTTGDTVILNNGAKVVFEHAYNNYGAEGTDNFAFHEIRFDLYNPEGSFVSKTKWLRVGSNNDFEIFQESEKTKGFSVVYNSGAGEGFNNVTLTSVEINRPDLIIKSISENTSGNSITVVVKNNGSGSANVTNSMVRVLYGSNYYDRIKNCDPDDTACLTWDGQRADEYNAGINVGAYGKQTLNTGEEYSLVFSMGTTIGKEVNFIAGKTYMIKAYADFNSGVNESDENNNFLEKTVIVPQESKLMTVSDAEGYFYSDNSAYIEWTTNGNYDCTVIFSTKDSNLDDDFLKPGRDADDHLYGSNFPISSDNSKYQYKLKAGYINKNTVKGYYNIICYDSERNKQTTSVYSFARSASNYGNNGNIDNQSPAENQITKMISNANRLNNSPAENQITKMISNANRLNNNKMDEILIELKQLRDTVKEQQTQIKYLTSLKKDVKNLTAKVESALNNFITYGVDDNTQKLGAGERAAVIASYKSAFSKLPETEEELSDAIKIANGRWPSLTNQAAENKAKAQFKKIYKKDADMNNAHDNAAITVMAYGLRQKAENRNLNSEKAGIKIFKGIYGKTPSTTDEWNIMQAITYSGASR